MFAVAPNTRCRQVLVFHSTVNLYFLFNVIFRVYIRDAERKQLSEQAMSLCVQSLKTQMKNVNTNSQTALKKLLLDIFRAYQRVQKHIQIKENTFATMLTDVYKQLVQEKVGFCLFLYVRAKSVFVFSCPKTLTCWMWLLNTASKINPQKD